MNIFAVREDILQEQVTAGFTFSRKRGWAVGKGHGSFLHSKTMRPLIATVLQPNAALGCHLPYYT
jgi:hypothetical protein